MKAIRGTIATLILLTACGTLQAQDDAFVKLKSYDFQERAPVEAIRKMIQQSLPDKEKVGKIEEGLVSVLDDPGATFGGKQEACRLLWMIGTARSVPSLAKMLSDEKLANIARYALERNTDPAAGKALRDALPQAKGAILVGLINSVGDRGEKESVVSLQPYLTHSDPLVASAAIIAMGKIGSPEAVKQLEAIPQKSLLVYQSLVRGADRLAVYGQKAEAARVYSTLTGTDKPAVIQAASLRGLASLDPAKASSLALARLKSADMAVQIGAAPICAALPDAASQSIKEWPTLPTPVQVALLASLAERHVNGAGVLAEKAVSSDDALLRTTGIHAFAALEGASAIPLLARVAAQGSDEDKQTAREVLTQMGGPDTEQILLQLARQGEPPIRLALVGVLGERGTLGGQAALLEMAHGPDDKLASESLKTLGRLGGTAQQAELIKILTTTQSDSVRDAAQEAVIAIAQRGNRDESARALVAALPGASVAARASLISVLAEIGGDQALTEISKAVTASEPEIKNAAITGLSDKWSDSRALPVLLNIVKTDSGKTYQVQALRGYIRLVGQEEGMSAADKVSKLQDAAAIAVRPEEKRQILGVLRDCRVPAAATLAGKMIDDDALIDDAADTILYLAAPQKKGDNNLSAVTGPETKAALEKVVRRTKDDSVRAKAQQLL